MKHPMQCAKCFRVCRLSDSGKTWVCTICKHREKANGGQAVSDHIGDTNKMVGEDHIPDIGKMVSDTPRTDAHSWHDGDYDDPLYALSDFARQLERELNAANERIQSLIEERDRANRLADWKWNLRGEFESLLGTDNIEKGIKAVKEMKQRIERLEEVAEDLVEQNDIYIRRQEWRKAKEAKP